MLRRKFLQIIGVMGIILGAGTKTLKAQSDFKPLAPRFYPLKLQKMEGPPTLHFTCPLCNAHLAIPCGGGLNWRIKPTPDMVIATTWFCCKHKVKILIHHDRKEVCAIATAPTLVLRGDPNWSWPESPVDNPWLGV